MLELTHLHIERRWLTALLVLYCVADSLNNAAWAIDPAALPNRLLTTIGWHPGMVSIVWVALALMIAPYAIVLWFNDQAPYLRTLGKMAALGLGLSAVLWLLLAYFSRHALGNAWLFVTYGQRALLSMTFAASLGISLNNGRQRELVRSHHAAYHKQTLG